MTDGLYRAFIEDIVVDAAWRKQGIGGEIVRHMLEALDSVEEVVLNCHDDLIPFYAAYGFRVMTMTHMNIWKGG